MRLKKKENPQSMQRVNYIDETDDESESEEDEEQLVLRVDGEGSKPLYMEGMMCGHYFKAIIDTGFPDSTFTKRDLKKLWANEK